jgi:hypothetical protein
MTADFQVHDTATFPVIHFRPEQTAPGYAPTWEREMDALLMRQEDFVIIFPPGNFDEAHEDRKARALWLKRNRDLLLRFCKALVSVEPDPVQRAAQQAEAETLAKAFNIRRDVVESLAAAVDLARDILDVYRPPADGAAR